MSIGIPSVLVLVLTSSLHPVTPTLQGEPTCGGQPKGAACWRELSNRSGCHVWTSNHEPGASVTWTADCADGTANGTGTLKWVWEEDRETIETTGRLRAGKRHGRWVMHWADGGVSEGKFAKGRRHGRWVERWTNGTVGEGRYVKGRRHGRWVIRDGYGTTHEGFYRDGKQHGKWVARRDGRVIGEAKFVEGEGRWVDK